MLSKTRRWRRSLKRFFDAFLVVGGVLLIIGVLLYSLSTIPKVSWLHDAGTALLVAGLSRKRKRCGWIGLEHLDGSWRVSQMRPHRLCKKRIAISALFVHR